MSAGGMTAQYLSDQAAQQQPVMNSLFTAFAGFTAFGAAIVAVLAGGGTLQNLANLWVDRASQEHPGKRRAWLWCRKLIVIVPPALIIILVVVGSGAGMLFSFFWLRGDGSGGWGWAYPASVVLFVCALAGVTLATLCAVVAALAGAGGLPGSAARKARRDRAARGPRHEPDRALMPARTGTDLSQSDIVAMTLATLAALAAVVTAGNQQRRQPERSPDQDPSQVVMSTADQ